MDRRQFLSAGSATALGLPLLSGCTTTAPVTALVTQPPAATGLGDTALNTLFDRIFDERMNASPGFATALGLDALGVSMRSRSAENSPVDRSTGSALMPLPPKSIPMGSAIPTI